LTLAQRIDAAILAGAAPAGWMLPPREERSLGPGRTHSQDIAEETTASFEPLTPRFSRAKRFAAAGVALAAAAAFAVYFASDGDEPAPAGAPPRVVGEARRLADPPPPAYA